MIKDFKEDPSVEEIEDFVKNRWKVDFWAVSEIGNEDNILYSEQIPVLLFKYCRVLEVDRLVKEGVLKSEDELLEVVSAQFPEKDWKKYVHESEERMKWKEKHIDYSDNPVHYECRESNEK